MAIEFKKGKAKFIGVIAVEEAELLLDWVQKNPKGKLDLEQCSHLHAAVLQLVLCQHEKIAKWPTAPELLCWLQSGLHSYQE